MFVKQGNEIINMNTVSRIFKYEHVPAISFKIPVPLMVGESLDTEYEYELEFYDHKETDEAFDKIVEALRMGENFVEI